MGGESHDTMTPFFLHYVTGATLPEVFKGTRILKNALLLAATDLLSSVENVPKFPPGVVFYAAQNCLLPRGHN